MAKNKQRKQTPAQADSRFLTWASLGLAVLGTLVGALAYVHTVKTAESERDDNDLRQTIEVSRILDEAGDLLGVSGPLGAVPFTVTLEHHKVTPKDLRLADRKIEEVLTLDKKNTRARTLKAFYYYKIGRGDLSVSELEKAVAQEASPDPVLLTNLGTLQAAVGKFEESISNLQKAIEVEPLYAPAYNSLGASLVAQSRYEEAESIFRKLIKVDPRYLPGYNGLGIALMASDRSEEAVAVFQRAMELDANYSPAIYHLGSFYLGQKQFKRALPLLLHATNLEEENHQAWFDLGGAYYGLGKFSDAVQAYRKAVALNPSKGLYYLGLGYSLLQDADVEAAVQALRMGISWDHELRQEVVATLEKMATSAQAGGDSKKASTLRSIGNFLLNSPLEEIRVLPDQAQTEKPS